MEGLMLFLISKKVKKCYGSYMECRVYIINAYELFIHKTPHWKIWWFTGGSWEVWGKMCRGRVESEPFNSLKTHV